MSIALGYQFGSVYTLREGGQPRVQISRPEGRWPLWASTNVSSDLIAFAAIAPGPPEGPPGALPGVFVADTSGTILAKFEARYRFRWSPDGAYLAIEASLNDSGRARGAGDLLIWNRRGGIVGRYAGCPQDYQWTDSGKLMIRDQGRVFLLDWRNGDTTTTSHLGVDVSPDRAYSIDATDPWQGPRVFDDRSHEDITRCSWGEVHGLGQDSPAHSFWIREAGLPHHLCVCHCDSRLPGLAGQKVWGCGIAVVDVETMDLLRVIPGKLIGHTADQTALVVLRGDTLAIVPLEAHALAVRARRASEGLGKGRTARIRAVVTSWNSKGWGPRSADTVGVYVWKVRKGTWLPGIAVGGGPRGMRVLNVHSAREVEIQYETSELRIRRSAPDSLPEGRAIIRPTPTILSTNWMDAGLVTHLSTVP